LELEIFHQKIIILQSRIIFFFHLNSVAKINILQAHLNKKQIMQKLTFVLSLLLSFSTLQLSAQTAPPSSVFTGRLFTTEGFEIKFKRFKMDSVAYHYQTYVGSPKKHIEADEILRIEKVIGTEAGIWALGMGVGGLLGSIVGADLAEERVGKIDSGKAITYTIAWTAGSTLLGLLIGGTQKKYKTIYENPKYKNNSQSFHFNLIPINKGGAFAFKYQF